MSHTASPNPAAKKIWMPPYCGRLGTQMTHTGAGHTVERFCVRANSSSQCPGGGPPYPQAYAHNTANWSPSGCPNFVRGNNTAARCSAGS